MADEARTGLMMPIPRPARTNPGSSTVQLESAWVKPMARHPAAMSRRAVPIM